MQISFSPQVTLLPIVALSLTKRKRMSSKKATTKPEDSDSDSSPEARNLPAELAGYRIEKLLGEGAYGKVYKAFDPESGDVYALQLVRCADESDVFYLQRE